MISKSLHPCAKTDSTVPPKSSARLNVGTITENNGSLAIPSQNLKELAVLPKVTPIVPFRPTGLNDQFALTTGGLALLLKQRSRLRQPSTSACDYGTWLCSAAKESDSVMRALVTRCICTKSGLRSLATARSMACRTFTNPSTSPVSTRQYRPDGSARLARR